MAWLSERWATRYHDHLTHRRGGGREGRRRGATGVVPGEDSVGGAGPGSDSGGGEYSRTSRSN